MFKSEWKVTGHVLTKGIQSYVHEYFQQPYEVISPDHISMPESHPRHMYAQRNPDPSMSGAFGGTDMRYPNQRKEVIYDQNVSIFNKMSSLCCLGLWGFELIQQDQVVQMRSYGIMHILFLQLRLDGSGFCGDFLFAIYDALLDFLIILS